MKITAQDTARILEDVKKKYSKDAKCIFTGCGFHIVIPNFFKGSKKDILKMKKIAKKYNEKFSEQTDYKTVEARRVRKTENSLIYKEGVRYIFLCKEVFPSKLENFYYQDYIYKDAK